MFKRFVLFLPILGVFLGCGSRELKVPVSPNYQSIQRVTLSQKCVVCHSSLATYSGVLAIATPGNPAQSQLYKVIHEGSMPQWSPKLSDAELNAIYTWILNGAAND